ncbi:GPP34 family phosphoprotein [Streptomyces shenzhenensis]|uniref:GPP34 family phosphoprotein n=1 Tax=Streptomyces shenzhenensis TaxID=943815 RepID=A0A3M0HVU7_9ACTN|nr:GPP34 family phosphoprotein [Streptomyces shenzhenensis]RMB80634.1 GPP34 family phosphoprotein [Streptomyces shenzhenensis]
MQDEMLIVEDLLLTLMDDRSGAIAGEGTLYYTLGGAVLSELALRGNVTVAEGDTGLTGLKVHAVSGRSVTDPLLQAAYRKTAERTQGVQTLLVEIGGELRGTVLDRLVERGMVSRERKRRLGLFHTTSLSVANTRHRAEVLREVRAALVDGRTPGDRTAVLIGLISASGSLPSLHRTIPWSGKVYERAKEFEKGSWGADAVNTAVMRTLMAITAGSTVAATTAAD